MRTGRVVGGVIVLDDDDPMEDGTEVTVFAKEPTDDRGFEVTEEEDAELATRAAAIKRGEYVEGEVVMKNLRGSGTSRGS